MRPWVTIVKLLAFTTEDTIPTIAEVASEAGPVKVVGSGFKLGTQSRTIHGAVPKLGEHTVSILQSLK
jgi:crotonobetainyl-CoA:carnitine CoA-transferase CaiB-like acyl-CoA transferase